MSKLRIKTSLDDLIIAFAGDPEGVVRFLNPRTGAIFACRMDEPDLILRRLDHGGNGNGSAEMLYLIPGTDSGELYVYMDSFCETVKDRRTRARLCRALQKRDPISRFQEVLLDDPEERLRWFSFKEKMLKLKVIEWLEDNNLEVE